MTALHDLLQDTVAQDRCVTFAISARAPCISRGKQFLQRRFLHYCLADHRVEMHRTADLAKVDLLYYSHALKRRGLFEIVETTTMKEAEIKRAKIGDRVKFEPLAHDAGEYCEGSITHKLGQRVEITWDDGVVCNMIPVDYTRVFLL